jgi:hypothetical protein
MYTAIGCRYVEIVQPTDTICLWVDEEGLLNQSDPNLLATLVAAELGSFPRYCAEPWWRPAAPTQRETPCH